MARLGSTDLSAGLGEVSVKGTWGWDRLGVTWRPEWGTGRASLYHGIVRRAGLRVGPLGFYRLWLRLSWPLDDKTEEGA